MKIKVRSGTFRFSLYLPLRLSAWAIGNYMKGKQNKTYAQSEEFYPGVKTRDTVRPPAHASQNSGDKATETPLPSLSELTKELKKARKNFGHIKIVDVKSANGDSVEITL